LSEAIERARRAGAAELDGLLHHRSRKVLETVMESPHLVERHLLILLSRRDLPREIVSRIAGNAQWMASYSMKVAVFKHPCTPRHVALPLVKFIYLFDLLGITRESGVPADLKRLSEDAILSQKEGIALGQRISLARRGSLRIASGLLNDADRRVIDAALSNPVLTEPSVAAALLLKDASRDLTEAVVNHPRWAHGHSVKLSLLRNAHLTLARMMKILSELTAGELSDLVSDKRVAANIRLYAARTAQARRNRGSDRTVSRGSI
jgi:hypothetical protein